MISWRQLVVKGCLCFRGKKKECELDKERKETIAEAKEARERAEKSIDNMIAQINGCEDRWFLKPIKTIDECNGNKME